MIMPGSAFDRQKTELDMAVAIMISIWKSTHSYTIAVCFDCQIKSIPADTFDRKPDVVMTECMIYR